LFSAFLLEAVLISLSGVIAPGPVTAVHHAGLVCLTYTPSKMGFLNQILSRPSNERPFLILVVGYPAKDTVLPKIHKKSLPDIAEFI
jgi:hypothetical protein